MPHTQPHTPPLTPRLFDWFTSQGWTPWPFQLDAWRAHAAGHSGLIHVPTGAGKTYAAYLPALSNVLESPDGPGAQPPGTHLRILYISPLRAVSRDIALAMQRPVDALNARAHVTIETRTADTSSTTRARQKLRLPTVLITTPESLSLLLTRDDCEYTFAALSTVIVDEWHELLSSKRGTQTELALARLRTISPTLRTWALSATLANLPEAARAAVGTHAPEPVVISGRVNRPVLIESVLPRQGDPFPWAGHLGLSMLPRVVESIGTDAAGLPARSTLVFTNTRNQAERWFHAIALARPDWEPVIALHHGSIDRDERERVESGLKNGSIRLVVATSSLDLGVDFAPVERVYQIGSCKGIARLLQRAGRASHRPGAACRIACVPTHGLEMIEIAAVRRALASGTIEPRHPEHAPLDVLAQHMVTRALGGGFTPDALYHEARSAHAYKDLSRADFDWTLALVERGGGTLAAYPEYHRVAPDAHGVYRVPDKKIAAAHRVNVGTITSDAAISIQYASGKRLGTTEESFVQKLRPGEVFVFSGKTLEFVRVQDLSAIVRPARTRPAHVPVWGGTRLPISESLGHAVRRTLDSAREALASSSANSPSSPADTTVHPDDPDPDLDPDLDPELACAAHLIRTQARLSRIPAEGETLVELCSTRDGHHCFVFPFEGRLVHGALAALMALRLSRITPATFSMSANDYGFELLSPEPFDFARHLTPSVLTTDDLAADAQHSVNLSALARAQFRDVARISGLVMQSVPGAPNRFKHVAARAGLIFDVFEQFDPGNLLLHQARREVLDKHFERSRLARTLDRLRSNPLVIAHAPRPTPLSLPLVVERIAGTLSSETLADRVARMQASWDT
jgi:ATP-dependent Lhr-like helicase